MNRKQRLFIYFMIVIPAVAIILSATVLAVIEADRLDKELTTCRTK